MSTLIAKHSSQEIYALYGQLTQEQQQMVFDYMSNISKQRSTCVHRDYSKYFGILSLSQDPLEIQKVMRNEWD